MRKPCICANVLFPASNFDLDDHQCLDNIQKLSVMLARRRVVG